MIEKTPSGDMSRGEATDPAALAEMLDDQRLMMMGTARAAAAPVRELRAFLPADGAPSPEARAVAERCRALILTSRPPVQRAA